MEKKNEIKNLHELGTDLLKVYSELREGSIDIKVADALANVAGKVIGAGKVLLEYSDYRGGSNSNNIPLLDN